MAQRRFEDDQLTISLSATNVRRKPPFRPTEQDDPAAATASRGQQLDPMSMAEPGPSGQTPREKVKTEQRIGAYKIIKTLGEGSFGKVKLAVHQSTGQQVALKIIARKKLISRDMAGRVEREIEYLQLLRHPHIIKLCVTRRHRDAATHDTTTPIDVRC
jgi:carbon catabolite-derepressing protein kinase